MESAPPPFAPPMRKSKTPMILLIVGVSLCMLCIAGGGAVWYFVNLGLKIGGPLISCAVSFEAARDAVIEYSQAHEGKLPKAATWQDDVKQYLRFDEKMQRELRDQQLMKFRPITKDGEWSCADEHGNKTGIAFNDELSGKKVSEIANPNNAVMLFEVGQPSQNAHQKYEFQGDAGSPKIMGKERGWITITLYGEGRMGENGKVISGRDFR